MTKRITNEQREAIVRRAVAERDALLAAKRPPCSWPGCGCAMPTGKDWHCPKQAAHSAAVLNSMCASGVKGLDDADR
jgi:hypothetical protein